MKSDVRIDAERVLYMFASLDSRRQAQAYRQALRRTANVIVREAKKNFRRVVKNPNSPNRWNGRPFSSGIRYSVSRDAMSVKAHIMGDFRLKFFELGTKDRFRRTSKKKTGNVYESGYRLYRTGNKRSTGRIPTGRIRATYFFKSARDAKEREASANMEWTLAESIRKVRMNTTRGFQVSDLLF